MRPLRPMCCLGLLWLMLGSNTQSSADVRIAVGEPSFRFSPDNELVLDREVKLAPEEFELSQQLRPLLTAGNYRAAYQVIETAPTPRSAALDLLGAQLLGIEGDYAGGIRLYQAALKKMPQLTRAHAGLGTLYLLTDQLSKARDSLAAAVRYGASDVQTFAQLAYLNQQLANPWSAISAYQQAMMLEPDNPQWQRGLLTSLIASGNTASATALIDELLAKSPTDASLWQQRANLAMKSQDTKRAVASLEAAYRLGDRNASNRLAAAQLHLEHGNYARAVELLSANVNTGAMSASDVYPLVMWLLNRRAVSRAGELITALARRSGSLSPADASLLAEMRGHRAISRGQLTEATRRLAEAVRADASNVRALLRLARLYLERGQLGQARVMFERAAAFPDSEKSALLGQAQVAIERQSYSEALRLVRTIQSRFPGSYELDGFVQSLNSLRTAAGTP